MRNAILVLVAAVAAVHAIPLNDMTPVIARAPDVALEMRDPVPTVQPDDAPEWKRQTGSTGAPPWKRVPVATVDADEAVPTPDDTPGWKKRQTGSTGAPPWKRQTGSTGAPPWKRVPAATVDADAVPTLHPADAPGGKRQTGSTGAPGWKRDPVATVDAVPTPDGAPGW